jgi:hypothetical protein
MREGSGPSRENRARRGQIRGQRGRNRVRTTLTAAGHPLADVGGHHVARPALASNTVRTQSRTSGPSVQTPTVNGTAGSRVPKFTFEGWQ